MSVANANKSLDTGSEYNAVFRQYLRQVQDKIYWIAGEVNVDVYFSLSQTPGKSTITQARCANLGTKHLDSMDRWRTVESANGRRLRFNMHQYCSETCLLIPTM